MLCVIGDLVEDIIVWLPKGISYGSDTPAQIVRRRGGSASNVAVFAAKVGQINARLIAQVGIDKIGEQLIDEIKRSGVDPLISKQGRTGSIVVVVSHDGERTMLTDRATSVDLLEPPKNWASNVSVLHIPAYSLFIEPIATTAKACIDIAHGNNIPVTIDASSAGLINSYGVEKFKDLLKHLSPQVLFCNRDEAAVLDIFSNQLNIDIVVVKSGPNPTTIITRDGVTTIDVTPVDQIKDTTGAGDAFAAGFLAKFISQQFISTNLEQESSTAIACQCVQAGHQLAARVLQSPGATMETQ